MQCALSCGDGCYLLASFKEFYAGRKPGKASAYYYGVVSHIWLVFCFITISSFGRVQLVNAAHPFVKPRHELSLYKGFSPAHGVHSFPPFGNKRSQVGERAFGTSLGLCQ